MKRSELKMTGDIYRLTPDNWGDTSIMVDEDECIESTADAFSISVDECDPDDPENGELVKVEIATDSNGDFYAVHQPQFLRGGRVINDDIFRKCQNPEDATQGIALLYGNFWEHFEEED